MTRKHPPPFCTQLSDIESEKSHLNAIKKNLVLLVKKKYLEDKIWEARRQKKLTERKKLNIVFVCSRPAAWGVFKSACAAFIADKRCDVEIVSVPELGGIGAWDNSDADYGVNCRIIDGYDLQTGAWFDIKKLEPDYVFFQTPYNCHRPEAYQSDVVSSYAKICYSLYGIPVFAGELAEISTDADFLTDCFAVFTQTEQYRDHLQDIFKNTPLCDGHVVLSGDARLEAIKNMPADTESPVWKNPRSECKLRIVWTPRWTVHYKSSHFTEDYKASYFLEYKDKLADLCRRHPGIELASRPHPLTFATCVLSGRMTEREVEEHKKSYAALPNVCLDERHEYQDTFVSSDVLLTDVTSIFHDYMLTGKPVIYCPGPDPFNEHSREVAKGFYWADDWQDVEKLILMIKSGLDPLKEKRRKIIKKMYYFPQEGVGNLIKNFVTEHFFA